MWLNDIALAKLVEPVPDTPEEVSDIQAVTLPDPRVGASWPEDDAECVLKGWGCSQLGECGR